MSESMVSGPVRRRLYVAVLVNLIFFSIVCYWLYENVNISDLRAHLQHIPRSAIAGAMVLNIAVLALFGARLAAILDCAKVGSCLLITTTGMTFNSLLPFRLGEGVKIYCGGAFFRLPVGGLGAAVVMEKIYDLFILIILLAVVSAYMQSSFISVPHPSILAVALALFLVILIIARKATRVMPPFSAWGIVRRLRLERVAEQAETLFGGQNIVRPAVLTLLIWGTNILLVLFFFRMVAPEIPFGVFEAMALITIASLSIAVPLSPAGLGVFEAGVAAYLTNVHGLQMEKAISAAVAYHFSIVAPHSAITTLMLAIVLVRRRRSVSHHDSR